MILPFHGKVEQKNCNIIKYQLLKSFIRERKPERRGNPQKVVQEHRRVEVGIKRHTGESAKINLDHLQYPGG